jgi:hypothetical protein
VLASSADATVEIQNLPLADCGMIRPVLLIAACGIKRPIASV